MEFQPFPKVPRLSREMIITEKLDGTNASVVIEELENGAYEDDTVVAYVTVDINECYPGQPQFAIRAGSRKRFVTPEGGETKGTDNYGWAGWVRDNAEELVKLGPGTHYGEWWGQGIGRKYGLDEKRFSLFNVGRWIDTHDEPVLIDLTKQERAPSCCHVVPVIRQGPFDTDVDYTMFRLRTEGSVAAPGFMKPEGIMIYHTAARQYFKKTFDNDEGGKG